MTDPSPQVLDRVITKWERSPGVRFDDVLSVYRFPFFSTDRQRDCVRSTWISEHQTINDRTFLVVPDRHIANQVRASLVYRVPVYYGKPETEMFDSSAVERVLGYSVAQHSSVNPEVRYAVCGPVTSENHVFHVIHTWGVNLESQTTDDYRMYIDPSNDRLIRHLYENTVAEMIKMIMTAATQSRRKGVRIRMPLIGLGAFLNEIPTRDRSFAYRTFFKSVVKSAEEILPRDSRVDIVIRDPSTPGQLSSTTTRVEVGDLFDVSSYTAREIRHLYLVNAWDPRSFIGNGGSHDPTIDGMMAAGYGPGAKLANSSYLHNPFFSTGLLAPERWVRI